MKKIAIGIDIGGTNTVFGAVDAEGKVYSESTLPTSNYPHYEDYPHYITDLASAIKRLLSSLEFEYELIGIGVGAPNAAYYRGTIERPANLWKFASGDEGREDSRIFPLADYLKLQFPMCQKVLITNDANAATLGEMMFGAARGMKDFIMATLGTGLGSGFVTGGEMIYGPDGMAGELGHLTMVRGGRECGCGLRGCLECYVSATGIKRTAFELMSEMRVASPLRDIPFNRLESLDIAKAAQAGDELAKEAFRRTGDILGQALAGMVATTTPEAIILFGGLAKAGEMIFEPTRKSLDENTMPSLRGKVKLLPSGVQDGNIAIMGAAALIWKECGE